MTMAFSKCPKFEEVDACEEDSTVIFTIDAQRLHAVMDHLSGSLSLVKQTISLRYYRKTNELGSKMYR